MRANAVLAVSFLTCLAGSAQTTTSSPQPPPPTVRPEDKCTIQGVVLNRVSGEPVKKTTLVLRRVDRPDASSAGASSEADGTFVIRDLEPGRYMLSASRNGFANQNYGARGSAIGGGAPLTLSPGQNLKDLTFQLVPHGVVTGRVLDEDGDPMANVFVQFMRFMFTNGKRQIVPFNGASTNDLGEYRAFALPPGRYYVMARYQNPNQSEAQDFAYQQVYYPNALDRASAVQLQIGAGQTVRGIDFTLRRAKAFHISGRVTDGVKTPANLSLMLVAKNSGMLGFERNSTVVRSGKFEFKGVLPGTYVLMADVFGSERSSSSARQTVTVSNSHVENLELVLAPGIEIPGRVVYDDVKEEDSKKNPANANDNAPTQGLQRVSLRPLDDPMGRSGGSAQVGDDGKFTLRNVGPALYAVTALPSARDAYVKAIRFGDADITDQPLDFSNGAMPGELTIVIGSAGGTLNGTVESAAQEKVSGIQVVAAPSDPVKREQNRLYKMTQSDQNGRFELHGLTPGDYLIFAFEQIEPGAYQDQEFLKPLESKAQKVTVKARGTESLTLKAIAAELTRAEP